MIKQFLKSPLLWLGLGVGVAIGMAASSGLQISSSDGTRFVGALMGSLIAVAGAISLHFLKAKEEESARRKNLWQILQQGRRYFSGILSELDDKNFSLVSGGLQTAARYVERCKRFCQAHECDDIHIGTVGNLFDHIDGTMAEDLINDDDVYSLEEQQEIRETVKTNLQFFDEAIKNLAPALK